MSIRPKRFSQHDEQSLSKVFENTSKKYKFRNQKQFNEQMSKMLNQALIDYVKKKRQTRNSQITFEPYQQEIPLNLSLLQNEREESQTSIKLAHLQFRSKQRILPKIQKKEVIAKTQRENKITFHQIGPSQRHHLRDYDQREEEEQDLHAFNKRGQRRDKEDFRIGKIIHQQKEIKSLHQIEEKQFKHMMDKFKNRKTPFEAVSPKPIHQNSNIYLSK